MRIGISALYRMNGGSITHLRHLLKVWSEEGIDRDHEVVIFARDESIEQIRGMLTPHVKLYPVTAGRFGSIRKILWEQFRFPGLLRREKIDVLFSTANTTPLFGSTPRVVALRNAGPFCPTIRIRTVGLGLWLYMKILGVFMVLSAFRASRVIFISEYFRRIFLRLGLQAERTDVIYHGRDASDMAAGAAERTPKIDGRYMLFIGNLYPYKNVVELVDAYARSRDYFIERSIKLAVVGNPIDRRYAASIRRHVEKVGLAEHVILAGGASHEEIHSLMRHCELFIFQSTCENCPNTLIEALAAALPIACSNAGVMPEIAGEAVVYFDPFDPDDIGRALRQILEDRAAAQQLRERARSQAQKFPTWRDVARRTFAVLQQAAQGVRV